MRYFDRHYFQLLREITVAQFKLRDQSTSLGVLWSILHPLLMLGVLFLFMHAKVGTEVEHYSIFLLIGIIHYTHFANCTTVGMTSLTTMKRLTRDTVFPKEILVIGAALAGSGELFISLAVCLGFAALAGVDLGSGVFLVPVVCLLQITTVVWVSLLLAVGHVRVKDLGHIYQVFLRLLMFLTPVFYSPDFAQGKLPTLLFEANPLVHYMSFSRALIIGNGFDPVVPFAVLTAANISGIFLALKIFRRNEVSFADRV